ncbi:MAG: ABC transporter ATP-binding protein, partial [Eubacteriales bacterium]
TDGVISMIIDCFKVIGIVISIFIFSSALGIFTICLVPIIGGLTSFFRKKMLLSQINNLKELGNVNNHISETIRNMLMIKSFSKEKYMEKNYKKFLEENYITMNKVNFYDSCYSPIIQIIMALSIAAIFYFSAGGTNLLGISIGMIAASVNLITNMFAPIDSLGMELQSIQKGLSGISSIDVFFAEKEIAPKKNVVDMGKLKKYGAKIDFNNMSFYYEKGKDVLRGINLEILPGEKVSFVGRTGVGKSTLFRLIEGLLEPTEGKLLINGMKTSQIGSKQKREIFGYVEQNFRFLDGNMAYQISLGDDTITEEQIMKAMDFVGLNDYVMAMEKGYEEDAKGGIMFSQGQKQLLSIARAIVTDPPILLLDEITANLDAVTEKKVVQVLKQAGKDKTILSIAHRISTVLNSDKVVLLENNRVKSVGTPTEIIRDSTWLRSNVDMEQLAK